MTTYPPCESLELDPADGWLTIRLARPEARNALTAEMVGELAAVLERAREDDTLRGITLRGAGGVFSAGGDIKGFKTALAEGRAARETIVAMSREAGALFHTLDAMPKVVVALVEGAAVAGGLGLACAADFVAVTADARFALTETTLGIAPAQIAPLIVKRTGEAAARRIMLTARRFAGREAAALGIADHVAEHAARLDAYEAEIRQAVMHCAPGANAATKELIIAARHIDGEAMLTLAAERFADGLLGAEGQEGVAAFLDKRKPGWAE